MYNKILFWGLNNLRAGKQVKLFVVVLFFSIELKDIKFKIPSRCQIPHSHMPLSKKYQYTFSFPGPAHHREEIMSKIRPACRLPNTQSITRWSQHTKQVDKSGF